MDDTNIHNKYTLCLARLNLHKDNLGITYHLNHSNHSNSNHDTLADIINIETEVSSLLWANITIATTKPKCWQGKNSKI